MLGKAGGCLVSAACGICIANQVMKGWLSVWRSASLVPLCRELLLKVWSLNKGSGNEPNQSPLEPWREEPSPACGSQMVSANRRGFILLLASAAHVIVRCWAVNKVASERILLFEDTSFNPAPGRYEGNVLASDYSVLPNLERSMVKVKKKKGVPVKDLQSGNQHLWILRPSRLHQLRPHSGCVKLVVQDPTSDLDFITIGVQLERGGERRC